MQRVVVYIKTKLVQCPVCYGEHSCPFHHLGAAGDAVSTHRRVWHRVVRPGRGICQLDSRGVHRNHPAITELLTILPRADLQSNMVHSSAGTCYLLCQIQTLVHHIQVMHNKTISWSVLDNGHDLSPRAQSVAPSRASRVTLGKRVGCVWDNKRQTEQ